MKKHILNKKINFTIISLCLLGALFFVMPRTQAQITNPVVGELGDNYEEAKDGSTFLNYSITLWRAGLSVGGLAVIALYLWGAFEWMSSGNDPKGAEKARTRIINATIGLILMVSTFTIIGFVSNLLFGEEFNLLRLTFPTATSSSGGKSTIPPSSPGTKSGGSRPIP